MLEIEKLTIGEARQIAALFGNVTALQPSKDGDAHWKIGGKYFIRTVTHHLTGKLVAVTDKELVLEQAAWIADDGRLHDALKAGGKFNEVEPFVNPVIVGRGSLIDATEISELSLSQK